MSWGKRSGRRDSHQLPWCWALGEPWLGPYLQAKPACRWFNWESDSWGEKSGKPVNTGGLCQSGHCRGQWGLIPLGPSEEPHIRHLSLFGWVAGSGEYLSRCFPPTLVKGHGSVGFPSSTSRCMQASGRLSGGHLDRKQDTRAVRQGACRVYPQQLRSRWRGHEDDPYSVRTFINSCQLRGLEPSPGGQEPSVVSKLSLGPWPWCCRGPQTNDSTFPILSVLVVG